MFGALLHFLTKTITAAFAIGDSDFEIESFLDVQRETTA